jgi:hypothetical protein
MTVFTVPLWPLASVAYERARRLLTPLKRLFHQFSLLDLLEGALRAGLGSDER